MRPVSRARSEAPGSRQGRTLGTSDGNRRNAIELWHAKQRQPLQRAAAPTPRGASSTTSAGREKSGRRPAFPVAPARRQRELLPLQPGAENPGQLPLERRHATRPVTLRRGRSVRTSALEQGCMQLREAPRDRRRANRARTAFHFFTSKRFPALAAPPAAPPISAASSTSMSAILPPCALER